MEYTWRGNRDGEANCPGGCAFSGGLGRLRGVGFFSEKGEALFVQNKPRIAQPLLESALNEDPTNEKIYLYLGIIYQQLGDPQKAIDVLKRGLNIATSFKDLFYYNMGNDFFSRKQYNLAEESYNSALSTNHNLAEAYLNRANARLQLQSYAGALADYTLFLQMKPQDPQRPNIEKVMALIRGSAGATSRKRAWPRRRNSRRS